MTWESGISLLDEILPKSEFLLREFPPSSSFHTIQHKNIKLSKCHGFCSETCILCSAPLFTQNSHSNNSGSSPLLVSSFLCWMIEHWCAPEKKKIKKERKKSDGAILTHTVRWFSISFSFSAEEHAPGLRGLCGWPSRSRLQRIWKNDFFYKTADRAGEGVPL